MKLPMYYMILIVCGIICIPGCSSSEKSGTNTGTVTPATQQPKEVVTKEIMDPPKQTENSGQQNNLGSSQGSLLVPQQQIPYGKFGVQVGAYALLENAETIAAVAKTRFSRNVYTMTDNIQHLHKVMIGDFTTKEEARLFRDRIVQQYPGEYSDAWVSEYVR